jgi:hypothetical protein
MPVQHLSELCVNTLNLSHLKSAQPVSGTDRLKTWVVVSVNALCDIDQSDFIACKSYFIKCEKWHAWWWQGPCERGDANSHGQCASQRGRGNVKERRVQVRAQLTKYM